MSRQVRQSFQDQTVQAQRLGHVFAEVAIAINGVGHRASCLRCGRAIYADGSGSAPHVTCVPSPTAAAQVEAELERVRRAGQEPGVGMRTVPIGEVP